MKNTHLKTADDELVSDGAAAMRKMILATRAALSVPKAKIDAMMAKEKTGRPKRR